VRRLAVLFLAAVLGAGAASVAAAQDAAKLEGDAKKAFDSGKFKEAGDKYAKAADAPDLAADRRADVHVQSAWSY